MHTQLSAEEREVIAIHYNQWKSYAAIGRILNRTHTTIKREIERNGKDDWSKTKIKYSCFDAQEISKERRFITNKKRKKLLKCHWLRELIHKKLSSKEESRSPEALAHRLKMERGIKIATNTIYSFIRNNSPWWRQFLRYNNGYKSYGKRKEYARYPESKHISLRPVVVDLRWRKYDYEWDSVIGSGISNLVTTTERKSRKIWIDKVYWLQAKDVVYKLLDRFKNSRVKTITFDRWSEFAYYETIEKRLRTNVYFTSPYSSWQKWSVERNNREIRIYLPKWSSFDDIGDEEIKKIEVKINRKPRRILWYRCSDEVFHSTNYNLL